MDLSLKSAPFWTRYHLDVVSSSYTEISFHTILELAITSLLCCTPYFCTLGHIYLDSCSGEANSLRRNSMGVKFLEYFKSKHFYFILVLDY